MDKQGILSNNMIWRLLLKCTIMKDLVAGRKLHSLMILYGIDSENTYGGQLIRMYGSCGSLLEADEVFWKVSTPSISTWSAIISAHAKFGEGKRALDLYCAMQQVGIKPNNCVFLCVLKACSSIGAMGAVQAIDLLNQQGIPVSKNLVHSLLQGCTKRKDLAASRRLFSLMISYGLDSIALLGDQLIRLFAHCGSLLEANEAFSKVPNPSVHTWNAIISAHANLGGSEQALDLYGKMQQQGLMPNKYIFTGILKACSCIGALRQGRLIQSQIVKHGLEPDVEIGNALVDMYAKCGDLEGACKVFEELPGKDVVSWGSIIVGFSQHGDDLGVLQLFEKLKAEGAMPNRVIYLCILKACGSLGALGQGRLIHDWITKSRLQSDTLVGSALIDMYAKCGNFEDVQKVFYGVPIQNVVSWGAIIGGYAQHGNYLLAAQHLQDMWEHGLRADDVIYTSLLTACSHAGLLEEGFWHFKAMRDIGIVPGAKHYNCLVDLLGRVGYLKEAEALLETMPVSADIIGWKSLLTSCRTYGDIELGCRCFDEVLQSDPHDASSYVLMSGICADIHMWEDIDKIGELRKCVDAGKKPGKAWIDTNKGVDEFIVGGTSHVQSGKICAKWKRLNRILKERGYMAQLDLVFGQLEKLRNMCFPDIEEA